MTRLFPATALAILIGGAAMGPVRAQEMELCNNSNIDGTLNNPAQDVTPCTFDTEVHITKIVTYHWNNGQGAPAGTVALRNVASGEEYGPFDVTTTSGQGGAPSVYWTANVDLTLPAGDYEVIDSDVATWSWNNASGGNGFVTISGEAMDNVGDDGGDPGDDPGGEPQN